MKILIATKNPGKFRDMEAVLLAHFPKVEFLGPRDIDGSFRVEENGKTFTENAIIKARAWGERSGLITIADDSGLEIDALDGEPGVLSRRWPGYEASDETLIQMTLEKLRGVPLAKRTARLSMVAALFVPGQEIRTVTEAIEGVIALAPCAKREAGYPFRSLFFLPTLNKFYIELSEEEHEHVNHRRRALERIIRYLPFTSNETPRKTIPQQT